MNILYKTGTEGTVRSTIPCTTRPSAPSLVAYWVQHLAPRDHLLQVSWHTEYNTLHHETIYSKSRGILSTIPCTTRPSAPSLVAYWVQYLAPQDHMLQVLWLLSTIPYTTRPSTEYNTVHETIYFKSRGYWVQYRKHENICSKSRGILTWSIYLFTSTIRARSFRCLFIYLFIAAVTITGTATWRTKVQWGKFVGISSNVCK